MYARIEWTRFRFSSPDLVSEDIYLSAKHYPSEFRWKFVYAHLLARFKRVGLIVVLPWVIAIVLIWLGSFLDFSDSHSSWSSALGTGCALACVGLIFSGIFTAGSFCKYALMYRKFWLRVATAARDSNTYSEFLPLLEKCKVEKTGLDRELSWWLILLILIVFGLIAYALAVKFMK
jgi:hypothetical protein